MTEPTRINLTQLREHAERAQTWAAELSPKWAWADSRRCSSVSVGYLVGDESADTGWANPAGDFADACDPATILALCDIAEAAHAYVEAEVTHANALLELITYGTEPAKTHSLQTGDTADLARARLRDALKRTTTT